MLSSRLLAFLILLSVLFEMHCHPAAKSTDREKLKNIKISCYFAMKRISNAESHERVKSTDVSTTCGGNLKKMETLLGPTKADLFGASSKLDLAAARSGFYSKSELDLKSLAEKLICDEHEKELVTKWSAHEYFHVKRKYQGGHTHQMCSFPDLTGEPHESFAKIGDSNTRYVSKEEARIFTLATGHHIHAGTPVCHSHHQQILEIIDEYNESDMERHLMRNQWYLRIHPLVLIGLPYGERVVITSTGQELRIPNTIRMMSQTEIVRQFTAYMIAIGKRQHLLSPSSIIRILNAIPATQQHSMSCVDSYLAKSYYSFQDLLKIVNRLHELTIIDKEGQAEWTNDVLEGQLYLRTDYKLHVKPESLIADHCMTFGLSDSQDPAFRKEETHEHKEQCPRCVDLARTFTELLKLIADAIKSATSESVKNELKELHFKVKSHQDIIERLKYHELRSAFTQHERHRIIHNMIDGECLLTGDFAQKWIPHFYMEEQKQYYGKSGRTWHGFHSLCRLEGQFVTHAFIHLLESPVQDSVVVTNLLQHVVSELRRVGISKVFVRTDNAAVYHSSSTIGSVPGIMEATRMKIDSWSFSERQDGKSSADRIFAQTKGEMLRYFESGKDVSSTHEMFLALTRGGTDVHLRGITVYEGNVFPPMANEKNNWKLPGIQDMGHFGYETDSEGKVTMRYWKYAGIGEGKTVTGMEGNAGRLVISRAGSRVLPEELNVEEELQRLRNNEECHFWINDVERDTVEEIFDADDDPAEQPDSPPPNRPSPPDLLHYCWCGSNFIRFQSLLNHLEWGMHKICPEKVTMTDFALDTFKRTIEDRKQTSSLLPLDDTLGITVDDSVPLLTEGFALFKRARGGALPASARSFVVKYYEEMKAKGMNADPEEAMNKQNMDPSVPFEDRLTFDQIKSLYCRLSHKKNKRKRSTTDEPMEVDDEGDDDDDTCGFGEWNSECRRPEPENDAFFVYYKYIQDNMNTLFLPPRDA